MQWTADLIGEVGANFLEDMIAGTIGEITGAACATSYCKKGIRPSKNNARAECFRIFSKHNLPHGTVGDSYSFIGDCADKCIDMTSTEKFKEHCGCK